jgi:hypothetical protein
VRYTENATLWTDVWQRVAKEAFDEETQRENLGWSVSTQAILHCLCFRALSERLRVVTDIGLGAAIGRRTYHRTGSVLEMHPHYQLCGSLAALVKDGANLARVGGHKTRAGGGGGGGGYTAVPSVPQEKSSGGGGEVGGSPRKQKKAKKDGRDERPGLGEGAQVEATARASVAGDAAGASETAAGDGGRWVHVEGK